jgi:hypothetical protein
LYSDYIHQRNERTLTLVETYYNQDDYTIAELLAVNMLLNSPDNEEAAWWLERIRAAKSTQEAPGVQAADEGGQGER